MPYGIDENLWKRLPPGDQASIKQSWQAARAAPAMPMRAATPTPTASGTATPHPVQPAAARPAAQLAPSARAARPVTPAYLHALTSAGDITKSQIPSVVVAAQQRGLASPTAVTEARHASSFSAPSQASRPARTPRLPSPTPVGPGNSNSRRLASVPSPEGIRGALEIFTPDPYGTAELQAWLRQHWSDRPFTVGELRMMLRLYRSQGNKGAATLVRRGWALEKDIARTTTSPTRRARLEAVLSALSFVLYSEWSGGVIPGEPTP